MTFESAGRLMDEEIKKIADYLETKFKPATKNEVAGLFRRVARELNNLAENLEKENR
jgi:hypothetical protein